MRKNLWMKIASVVLALVLWVFVLSRGSTDFSVQAKVHYSGVAKGLEVVPGTGQETMAVRVRAHERFLQRLAYGDIKVMVDTKGLGPGEHRVSLEGGDVDRPFFINFVSISPSFTTFTLKETVTGRVAVTATVVGTPAPGYKVLGVEVIPPDVMVSGTDAEVQKVHRLRTEAVDITGANKSVVRNARVENRRGNFHLDTDIVAVRVIIGTE